MALHSTYPTLFVRQSIMSFISISIIGIPKRGEDFSSKIENDSVVSESLRYLSKLDSSLSCARDPKNFE